MRLIESTRVLIRSLESTDFDQYCELWNDNDVRQNFRQDERRLRNWKDKARFEGGCNASEPNEFAVVDSNTGAFLGRAQFGHAVDFGSLSEHEFEVMIALSPFARGRGIGQEATSALIEWLFQDQHATRILAKIVPGNGKSERMAKTLGFVPDLNAASSRDPQSAVFVLTREAWNASEARRALLA